MDGWKRYMFVVAYKWSEYNKIERRALFLEPPRFYFLHCSLRSLLPLLHNQHPFFFTFDENLWQIAFLYKEKEVLRYLYCCVAEESSYFCSVCVFICFHRVTIAVFFTLLDSKVERWVFVQSFLLISSSLIAYFREKKSSFYALWMIFLFPLEVVAPL